MGIVPCVIRSKMAKEAFYVNVTECKAINCVAQSQGQEVMIGGRYNSVRIFYSE